MYTCIYFSFFYVESNFSISYKYSASQNIFAHWRVSRNRELPISIMIPYVYHHGKSLTKHCGLFPLFVLNLLSVITDRGIRYVCLLCVFMRQSKSASTHRKSCGIYHMFKKPFSLFSSKQHSIKFCPMDSKASIWWCIIVGSWGAMAMVSVTLWSKLSLSPGHLRPSVIKSNYDEITDAMKNKAVLY